MQDAEFDKGLALNSIPANVGKASAMNISSFFHILCGLLIFTAGWFLKINYSEFNWMHWVAAVIFVLLLLYQHSIVKVDDLSKVNLAFFTTNGIASLVFGALVILDIYI